MGDINLSDKKAFEQLMYVGHLRGDKAAGVVSIKTSNDECFIWKAPWPAIEVIEHTRWGSATPLTANAYLGHTRQPTVGPNIRTNAQPFSCGRIIGTHNG